MRFDCGPTAEQRFQEKRSRLMQWHPWFAWYPVRIDHTNECVWLETIERRQHIGPMFGTVMATWYRLPAE